MDPDDIEQFEGESTCCDDSGVECQIRRMLTKGVDGEEERRITPVPKWSKCITSVITVKVVIELLFFGIFKN